MKEFFIKDLKKDGVLNSEIFAIFEVKKAEDKNGRTYYDLIVGDKTGQLKAKIWNDTLSRIDSTTIKPDCLVYISGKIDEYRGALQITITNISLCEDDISYEDFVAVSEFPTSEMVEELNQEIKNIENNEIRKVLQNIFSDKEILNKYKSWPAASTVHHDFKSGLLQHVLEMLNISKGLKRFYSTVDYDVLTAGIILHDIGKIEELEASGLSTSYSVKGTLMGHITLGLLLWTKFAKDIVSEEHYIHIAHLILSHHGSLEMGSPVMPATIEAYMLTFLDNLSSKSRTAQKYVSELSEEEEFTSFIRWLDGVRLWKGTKFTNVNSKDSSDANLDNEDDQIPLV